MSGTTWVSRKRQTELCGLVHCTCTPRSPRRPVSDSPVRAAVPPELQDHLGALVFSLTVDFTSTHRTISSQCGNRSRKRCSRAHSLICRRPSWGCSTGLSHMSALGSNPCGQGDGMPWSIRPSAQGGAGLASPASHPWGGGGLFPQIKYGCCPYRGNRCSLI